jgi:hypothetical protein
MEMKRELSKETPTGQDKDRFSRPVAQSVEAQSKITTQGERNETMLKCCLPHHHGHDTGIVLKSSWRGVVLIMVASACIAASHPTT